MPRGSLGSFGPALLRETRRSLLDARNQSASPVLRAAAELAIRKRRRCINWLVPPRLSVHPGPQSGCPRARAASLALMLRYRHLPVALRRHQRGLAALFRHPCWLAAAVLQPP